MNYASLQMVPFASPAPFTAAPAVAGPAGAQPPRQTRRRPPHRTKKKKQQQQQARKKEAARGRDEEDVIAPVPSSAGTGTARRSDNDSDNDYDYDYDYDDVDDMSLEEFDKDAAKHGEQAAVAAQPSVSAGVEKIEHVTRSWTPAAILVAWTGMMLLAVALSLDSLTVSSYQPYALSEFKSHSMLPAVSTLQNIL
ncbi:hypothetical protein V2A60_002892 [Cordyceps javanica]|nr:hypothetical protein IF2G_06196 [Cordyceps javanica]